MGRAMVIRCFQGNNDIAILGQKQACLRNVWPSDMPPQMFEFLFLTGMIASELTTPIYWHFPMPVLLGLGMAFSLGVVLAVSSSHGGFTVIGHCHPLENHDVGQRPHMHTPCMTFSSSAGSFGTTRQYLVFSILPGLDSCTRMNKSV